MECAAVPYRGRRYAVRRGEILRCAQDDSENKGCARRGPTIVGLCRGKSAPAKACAAQSGVKPPHSKKGNGGSFVAERAAQDDTPKARVTKRPWGTTARQTYIL